MANSEHVEILLQGAKVWNKWREHNPDIKPDFINADLTGIGIEKLNLNMDKVSFVRESSSVPFDIEISDDLELANDFLSDPMFIHVDLSNTNLHDANFQSANLNGVIFDSTDLSGANLDEVDFSDAKLNFANFRGARLSNINLSSASLSGANLRDAQLSNANFKSANLSRADLSNAYLNSSNLFFTELSNAIFNYTICSVNNFVNVDLSTTKGLDTIHHLAPSYLGVETLFRSKGKIPEIFLRGCGVPETLITFLPSMIEDAIMFYSCFISYSHEDEAFAQLLHDRLQGQGIRCWLDKHQVNPGDPLHPTIYEGIRVYDKIVLCCSKASLSSWWVEKEFTKGMKKEEDYKLPLIIPLNLDGYILTKEATGWVVDEIKQRNVADFTNWKDHDAFEQTFEKVVKALRTDGGKPPPPVSRLPK